MSMKFDYIFGNPPYNGTSNPLYLQILERVNIIGNEIIWLCPTQWVKSLKFNRFYEYYKKLLKGKLAFYKDMGYPFKDICLVNSVGIFNFKNDVDVKYDIESIKWQKFNNIELTKSIYDKANTYSMIHGNIHEKRQNGFYGFYVKGRNISGNKKSDINWEYTLLVSERYRNDFSIDGVNMDDDVLWWSFKTEQECVNFTKYLENDITMFLLFVLKNNRNNHCGECKLIPWFDFTKEITNEYIQKELNFTNEEMEYMIKETISLGKKAQYKNKKNNELE